MKRIFFLFSVLTLIIVVACNNSDDKKVDNDKKTETPRSTTDSLMEDIMNGHDVGMAKMGKLSAMQNQVQSIIDSIGKLSAKTKKTLNPYKADMDKVLEDLKSARTGMEKWMDEFNMDSALSNIEQRIKYLRNEKWKVTEVKESILKSLQKADSLMKRKF
jgi:DNA repair ATPase RecN